MRNRKVSCKENIAGEDSKDLFRGQLWSYLEEDREDESEAELIAEGRHGPPQDGAEEQGQQPEEGAEIHK